VSQPKTQPRGDTATTVTILAITSLTIVAGATIAPSLPSIRDHFVDTANVELLTRLLLTIPALAIALFAPGVGWVLDRYGRKRVIFLAIIGYAIAGTAGLYLDSLLSIIVSRALLGMCVAGTLTGATTLVGDYFSGNDRNRVLGLQAGFTGFAGVVALVAGGSLAELHWRAPFFLYFLALPIIPMVLMVVREPGKQPREILEDGTDGDAPMRTRVIALVATIYAVSYTVQIAFYMMPVQLPFYLVEMGEPSPSRAGISLATMTLCASFVAISFRWIREWFDRTVILTMSLGGLGIGFLLVARANDYGGVMVGNVVIGIAMGLNFPNLMGWLMARTPSHIRGRMVGGLMTCVFLGQFSSPIVSQPLISRGGLEYGYRGMGILLLCVAALAGLSAGLKSLQRRRSQNTPGGSLPHS
jgi:MFS family permease